MASGAKQLLGGLVAAVSLALLAVSGCGSDRGMAFSAHGSVQQVYVLGARPASG